jgi:hypothetical protein
MQRVEEIYVWVSENPPPADEEGIVAGFVPGTGWISLTGVRLSNMERLRPLAQQIAQQTGRRLRLLRLTLTEELEVIEP